MALHNKIGEIGEDLACKYIRRRGYKVLMRNYFAKTGEIDIVSRNKVGKLVFFEVKSVSCENINDIISIRPEENLHSRKLEKLYRTIDIYLNKHHSTEEEWILLLITVRISLSELKSKIEIINVL